jgi:hypothetical protein
MRKLLAILLAIIFLVSVGCAAVPCICPPVDVMFGHNGCGDSYMFKGFFKEENRGLYWIPRDEYRKPAPKPIDRSKGI